MLAGGNMGDGPSGIEPKSLKGWIGWIAGAAMSIGAFAMAWYSGVLLLILGSTAVAWWAGKQVLRKDNAFLLAAAIQAGHMAWKLIVMLTLPILDLGVIDIAIAEIAILAVGISWLLYRPGLRAVMFLTVYQLLALSVDTFVFLEVPAGTNVHRETVGVIVWRLMALFLMWDAFVKTRRNSVHAAIPGH
jgi:hypothetical protein